MSLYQATVHILVGADDDNEAMDALGNFLNEMGKYDNAIVDWALARRQGGDRYAPKLVIIPDAILEADEYDPPEVLTEASS